MIKPQKMQPGQTVGLIAPSFALPKPELLPKAVAALEGLGYRVKVGESCLARHGYLAGNDALRARDINSMFTDDSIDAILCIRGGYGATRILPLLDYDAIRANPKVFSGFSDVTALHSAIGRHAGLVTFHGVMAVSDMANDPNDDYSLDMFWKVVSSPAPAGPLNNPPEFPRRTISPGQAQGPIVGGNLSLVASCVGTPYAPDFDGTLLFLEDISERSYAIDRMLTQLQNAGVFDRVAGILLGEFTDCDERGKPQDFTVAQVMDGFFEKLGKPVLAGIRCGHVIPRMTLPLGVPCALDADAQTLSVLEGAVI